MVPSLAYICRCLSASSCLRERRSANAMFQKAISSGMSPPFTLTRVTGTSAKHISGLSCIWLSHSAALRPTTGSGFRQCPGPSASFRLSCSASAADAPGEKKRLVFLGTPEVCQTRQGRAVWHAFPHTVRRGREYSLGSIPPTPSPPPFLFLF